MKDLPLWDNARRERKREVQREHDRRRGNSAQRGYDGKWRRERLEFIAAHPRCCECGEPTEQIDHDPPHKGDREKFWNKATWRPMCARCHRRKGVLYDGVLGRQIRNTTWKTGERDSPFERKV